MIGILFCKHFGEVIGEITENLSGGYIVKNPERFHHTQDGSFSVKITLLCVDDTITIDKDELALKGVFTPIKEVADEYESRNGKTNGFVVPEKKLIL